MANKNLKSLISVAIITIFIISNLSIIFAVGEHNQSSTSTTGNHTPDQGTNNSGDSSGDNQSKTGQGTGDSGTNGGGKKTTKPTTPTEPSTTPAKPTTTPTTPANDTGTNQEDPWIKKDGEVSLGDLAILVIFIIAVGLMVQKSRQESYKTATRERREILMSQYYQTQLYINVLMPLLYALIPFIPDEAITLSDFDKYLA